MCLTGIISQAKYMLDFGSENDSFAENAEAISIPNGPILINEYFTPSTANGLLEVTCKNYFEPDRIRKYDLKAGSLGPEGHYSAFVKRGDQRYLYNDAFVKSVGSLLVIPPNRRPVLNFYVLTM